MAPKQETIQSYRPVLSVEARNAFTAMADSLGFVVTRPSLYLGEPSVRDMLESLAAAYERDPAGVRLALKVLGVVAEQSADDVRFTSETPPA